MPKFLVAAILLNIAFAAPALPQRTAPQRDSFEVVLLPIVTRNPLLGLFGSIWNTDVLLLNTSDRVVLGTFHSGTNDLEETEIFPVWNACLFPNCNYPTYLHPGITYENRFDVLRRPAGMPPGLLLYIHRAVADQVTVSIRVGDVSRANESLGTEIQVVRQNELRPGPLQLLGIPTDGRFRKLLRIYDPLPGSSAVANLKIFSHPAGALLHEEQIALLPPPVPSEIYPGFSTHPDYAEFNRFDRAGEATPFVRIEVMPTNPDEQLWAFVTITNNDTQQVTTVTPQ